MSNSLGTIITKENMIARRSIQGLAKISKSDVRGEEGEMLEIC